MQVQKYILGISQSIVYYSMPPTERSKTERSKVLISLRSFFLPTPESKRNPQTAVQTSSASSGRFRPRKRDSLVKRTHSHSDLFKENANRGQGEMNRPPSGVVVFGSGRQWDQLFFASFNSTGKGCGLSKSMNGRRMEREGQKAEQLRQGGRTESRNDNGLCSNREAASGFRCYGRAS